MPASQLSADDVAWLRLGKAASAVRTFTLLCRYNSNNTDADAPHRMHAFHSVAEPPVPLEQYLAHILKHAECGEMGVLLGLCLAGRYCSATKCRPSALSAHRLVLACILVGVKAHMDQFRSNRTYARVGGVCLKEMNEMEVLLLSALDYRVTVTEAELQSMQTEARRATRLPWSGQSARNSAAVAMAAFVHPTAGLPKNGSITPISAGPSSSTGTPPLPARALDKSMERSAAGAGVHAVRAAHGSVSSRKLSDSASLLCVRGLLASPASSTQSAGHGDTSSVYGASPERKDLLCSAGVSMDV